MGNVSQIVPKLFAAASPWFIEPAYNPGLSSRKCPVDGDTYCEEFGSPDAPGLLSLFMGLPRVPAKFGSPLSP